jgi:hypothetical protein
MKKTYSTYTHPSWKAFKKFSTYPTELAFCQFGRNMLEASVGVALERGSRWPIDSCYTELLLEFLWRFRKITHYFLDANVAEFCISSVKEFSPDYCKRLPLCDMVDIPNCPSTKSFIPSFGSLRPEWADKMPGGFAVHFPTKESMKSVMVVPDAFIYSPLEGCCRSYYFAACDGENVVHMQTNESDFTKNGSDDSTIKLSKLIFGLSLYMDAFPAAVTEANLGDIHKLNHYTGPRNIVTSNDIIDEELAHIITPHWRRGHFRLLSSPKFIYKCGQTVYVRGSFVRGQAFTVLDDVPTDICAIAS